MLLQCGQHQRSSELKLAQAGKAAAEYVERILRSLRDYRGRRDLANLCIANGKLKSIVLLINFSVVTFARFSRVVTQEKYALNCIF